MKKTITAGMMLLVSLFSPLALAEFDEGIEYVMIDADAPMDQQASPEVVEFFWYGCPHCYKFEPHLEGWLKNKPDDVQFVRLPATFNKLAEYHARVFFALDLMGEADRLMEPVFNEIHNKKNRLDNDDKVKAFLAANGFDERKIESFSKAMSSFAVQTRVRQAQSLFRKYGLRGVPSIVVSGRYRSGEVKNYNELVQVTDHMIDLVRKDKSALK